MIYVHISAAIAVGFVALSTVFATPSGNPAGAARGDAEPRIVPQVQRAQFATPASTPTISFALPDRLTMPGFPQWTAVMARGWARDSARDEICSARLGQPCRLSHWRHFLDSLRDEHPATQLQRVNRFINQIRYQADDETWGKIDYWAAPGEFFASGGDCEDFAIAKFYSMKTLGFPTDAMRIMVLRDTDRSLMHAVLVVTWQGREWVLDNLSDRIVSWADRQHYQPIYSINEARYQLHQDRHIALQNAAAAGN